MFIFNDGGRAAAGYKGTARDCVTRSMAIAIGIPYKQAYAELAKANALLGFSGSPRNGIYPHVSKMVLERHGYVWHKAPVFPGRKARCADLAAEGVVIAKQSRHLVAVIDGVPHDTHDTSGKVVYGYYKKV